jgi:hypothetical protein
MKVGYRVIWTVLALGLVTPLTSMQTRGADENRRDGNWWRQQPQMVKVVYIVGFFDGMELGSDFSFWKYMDDETLMAKTAASYREYNGKYFGHVTSGQLADGLDNFYQDYRNRQIRLQHAVWLVVNAIAGTPQAELDKMIENWRKNPG